MPSATGPSPGSPAPRRADPPTLITTDRTCVKCGYNLRGLSIGGVCPECGRKIQSHKHLPRYADQMIAAPMPWLRGFSLGTLLLAIGGTGMVLSAVACMFITLPAAPPVGGGGGSWQEAMLWLPPIFAAIWSVGVFFTMRPRPVTPATLEDPSREWRRARLAAQASQPFWLIGFILAVIATGPGVAGVLSAWVALGSIAIAAAGCGPLFYILSNLAYWASDTGLADRLRICAWSIGVATVLLLLILSGLGRLRVGGFAGNLVFAFLFFIGVVIPLVHTPICLWQLSAMGGWVVVNSATAGARDDRLRRKAERERALHAADPLPPVDATPSKHAPRKVASAPSTAPRGKPRSPGPRSP